MKKNCNESDNMKRARIIEKRLIRLEKMMKNESALPYDVISDLNSVFYDHFGNEDNYDSVKEFEENMFAACEGDNDMMVDDAIMYLANDYGHDEEGLEDLRDDIADYIAGCAEKVCEQEGWKEEWDEEEFVDIDHEYDEALKRRVARLEKLIVNNKVGTKKQKVEKRSLVSRFKNK